MGTVLTFIFFILRLLPSVGVSCLAVFARVCIRRFNSDPSSRNPSQISISHCLLRTSAQAIGEVQARSESGKYPYYWIPSAKELASLIDQLGKRYKCQYIPGHQGLTREGNELRGHNAVYDF